MDPKIIKTVADAVSKSVKDYLATFSAKIDARLKAIEEKEPARGEDGRDGRDAFDLEILPEIDPTKSYTRGTYASHKNGLVRSYKTTEPLEDCVEIARAGWDVVVCGICEITTEISEDFRAVSIKTALTNGKTTEASFGIPAVIDRGVYNAEKDYSAGDGTTWGGSFWIAQTSTKSKPGEGSEWRLAVKRGRDGKDGQRGEKGAQGLPGQDGRHGRDLTQMGYNGQKY